MKIIHEEALKCWLPFNQNRYLKKNYKEKEDKNKVEVVTSMDEPSLEELEGKVQEIDEIMEISSTSDEDEKEDFSETIQNSEIKQPEACILTDKVSDMYDTEEKQCDYTPENYEEFDDVLNCVEEFEHNKALQKSENSFCDDSDSDDEEANLIKKKFKTF